MSYSLAARIPFDWSNSKKCKMWRATCKSCLKVSMHLTYEDIGEQTPGGWRFKNDINIDENIFYSVPSSFFTIDSRVPKEIRELISEAEGCVKMNYLTGASACTRKAIYEVLTREKAVGQNYDDRITWLKDEHPEIDQELFEILAHIKDMTSDKVHEQSWDKWSSSHLKLFLETLKAVLHELYVLPDEKEQRVKSIRDLKATLGSDKKTDSGAHEIRPAEAEPQRKANFIDPPD